MRGPRGMGRAARIVLSALAVAVLWAAPAAAQGLGIELRAGGAIGNYSATEAGLDIAPSLSAAALVEVGLTEMLGGYVGGTFASFSCNEGLCTGRDVTLASVGATAGGRLSLGSLWVRAGAAFQSLHQSSDAETTSSDFGIGWDLGIGTELDLGGLALRPGVTYLRHGASTGGDDAFAAVLAFEIGVLFGL